jgi:hypothetical protein
VPMLEGSVGHVIGVDTHRDRHTAAVLDPNGGLVAQLEIPSDQAGSEVLLDVGDRAGTWPALLGGGGDRLLRRWAGQLPSRAW